SFEYDTEGNINKVNYYAPHYDTNEIQLLAEITITEKNNQIIRHDAHDNVTVIYTLNEENQVVKRECETCETLFMQYEEGKVSKLIVHSSDGSFAGESSYEYDIGINPINVLFKKFRFLENYQTNFLDYTMEYYLTNLVTKEYDENGEVKFISTYEKNEFGYPTHAYWRAPKIGESGIATFEY